MTNRSQAAEAALIAIALEVGLRAEYHPTNPPKLIGFAKFVDGQFSYAVPIDDFEAVVRRARLRRQQAG